MSDLLRLALAFLVGYYAAARIVRHKIEAARKGTPWQTE